MRSNLAPMGMDEVRANCPAAFQTEAHPDRTEKYVHISTEPVIAAMRAAGYGVSRAQQTHSRAADARGFARHLLSFRPLEGFSKPSVGGAVPEVVLLNSHDGNCAYRLHVGLYRFVCENGLMTGEHFESISVRHRGSPAFTVVEESEKIFKEYVPRLKEWVANAESTILTKRDQQNFAQEAAEIRFGKGEPPFDPNLLLNVRREADAGDNVWSIYNRVQENVMRGGIEFQNINGRRCVTKPINRVTKDVIYNQKLWTAANDYMAQAA